MENTKKRKYNNEVMKINATFTPLIFSSNGGTSRETARFYQRLAELLSDKHSASFSCTSLWIKRKIMFSLIRTAVVCIRGSRGLKSSPLGELPMWMWMLMYETKTVRLDKHKMNDIVFSSIKKKKNYIHRILKNYVTI